MPAVHAGVAWVASPGGPGPVPAITLTAASGTNAIKRSGTNGINVANSTTFEDLSANFLAAPAVNAGDSLYIGATAYEIAVVVSGTELTLVTPIVTAHTATSYAAYKIATQFTFSAPTVAVATIQVLVTPIPAGTDIVCTRPGRADIILRSVAGAPPAFLPPINGNSGVAYFDGSGTIAQIATSIRRAINNIPAVTSVTLPNVVTSSTTCMPLGRATDDGVDTISIYGITQTGRVGTLDTVDQPWASRSITGSPALFTITQFTTAVDANAWPDSPIYVNTNQYVSGIKNVMWNVYKALVNSANGLVPYIIPQTSSNFFADNTVDDPLIRTIYLVATFNGTNGNNMTAAGTSPAPPSPPPNPKRVYINLAGNPDPENFAGGIDPLPTVAAVSVASSVYIPASSAITLSIGSEGNRQALNTSSFWATEPGSKFGIVLRSLSGEDVQCNVTYIQNRGYPDGV
nr:hypothetical protein [Oxalobacteraceae bacterium]